MIVLVALCLFFSLIGLFRLYLIYLQYNRSNYKTASGNGFMSTMFDKGNYGEFLTVLASSYWL